MCGTGGMTQIPGSRMTWPFSRLVQHLLGPVNTAVGFVPLDLLKSRYSPCCSVSDVHALSSREI